MLYPNITTFSHVLQIYCGLFNTNKTSKTIIIFIIMVYLFSNFNQINVTRPLKAKSKRTHSN